MRNEISQKNPYYLSKHRYLELKHFCLQYPEWKSEYQKLCDGVLYSTSVLTSRSHNSLSDPVGDMASRMSDLAEKMNLVESSAKAVDPVLGRYIFEGVTADKTYTWLKTAENIPCGKNLYYTYVRKFYDILSRSRN